MIKIAHILELLSPVVALIAGGIATWFLTRIHFLSDFHTHNDVGQWLEQVLIFLLSTILVWLSEQRVIGGLLVREAVEDVAAPAPSPREVR